MKKNTNPFNSPLPPPKPPHERKPLESEPVPKASAQPAATVSPSSTMSEDDYAPINYGGGGRRKIILAALALLLILGSVGGWFFWFTSPERVVSSAVSNIIKSQSSIVEAKYQAKTKDGEKVTAELLSKTDHPNFSGELAAKVNFDLKEFKLTVDGNWLATKDGDVYIKLNNLSKLYFKVWKNDQTKDYLKDVKFRIALKRFIKKIDKKWIKLDMKELAQAASGGEAESKQCYQKAAQAFYENSDQQQQIVDAYKNNKFITINTSPLDDFSIAQYEVGLNVKKSQSFAGEASKSDVVKAFNQCQDGEVISSEESSDEEIEAMQKEADKFKTKLTIDRWSGQLLGISTQYESGDGTGHSADIKTDFSQNITVKAPEGALSLKDIEKELENLMKEWANQSLGSSSSDDMGEFEE